MRLTNAAQVHIPDGPVTSLTLTARTSDRAVPVSFDQERHVAMGQRPGSWMAVAFRLEERVDPELLAAAWLAVVRRHGTLRTGFDLVGDQVVLHELEVDAVTWIDHPADGRSSRDVVRAVLDRACQPFNHPSHRLCLIDDDRPAIVIGADHAHVDAWSLLLLARDLTAALAGDDAPVPPAFAEHTIALGERPDPPEQVVSRWAEIIKAGGGVMPTFPLDLGDVTVLRPEVVEVRDVLDAGDLTRLESVASAQRVGIISVAMTEVVRAFRLLADAPLRAVFPVHSRYDEHWHDSVGWFITNSVLEVLDPDPQACRLAIKEAIELGSHALAPIMKPYGGMPAAPGMFAISWLDHRRLPVEVPDALEPQHVSAVIETDGVMIWFVVNHSGLHLRCRYPDTPEARVSVGTWLDAVCDGLVRAAAE